MAAIAGRVMPLMKGAYNSATTYKPLDFVTYNNALWGCIKETTGNTPTEGTYWKKLIDGEVGDAASLGGETATQWQTKIDNIQTTSRATLSTAGWYRVAAITNITAGDTSDYYNLFRLACRYGSSGGVSGALLVGRVAGKCTIDPLGITCNGAIPFTKIRVTNDGIKDYIEVYYSFNVTNACAFSVNGLSANYGTYKAWKAITPTLTEETVDGVTVTTTYDIPANASPVTDLDLADLVSDTDLTTALANYLPKTGGDVDGNLTAYSNSATARILAVQNSIKRISHYVDIDGSYTIKDVTDGENILRRANGTNTFNGTASGNLPLTGGTVNGAVSLNGVVSTKAQINVSAPGYYPLNLTRTDDDPTYITFTGSSGGLGKLGFRKLGVPAYMNGDGVSFPLLHTGNSAKVAIQETAPTDTTALWVDTANKVTKAYIDGAWTVIA